MTMEKLKKRGIKWHRLRHTFACQYLREGGSIEYLSDILGHESITTTERYARLYNQTVQAEFEKVRGIAIGHNLG
jgi:site-specific recombinase XerD